MLTARDMRIITAAINDHTRWVDAKLDPGYDLEADRIDVRLLVDALDCLLARLKPLSPDGVKVQINEDTLPFGLLYRLNDNAADAMRDATPPERAKLMRRLRRVYSELARLRLVAIPDETGESLRITTIGDEPAPFEIPDFLPAA